ncbi:hypothetical protein B0O99DRAFT_600641 [Bisporella sp. PMI_857]|nr:hypothetical protein B0O99DRAFT_600641 [Bisporella sp. PMI_857]
MGSVLILQKLLDAKSILETAGLCVTADHPVPAGVTICYYEIHIDEGSEVNEQSQRPNPELAIGVCTSPESFLRFPGLAYHGDGGCSCSSVGHMSKGKSQKFGPGDTIGCDGFSFGNVTGRIFPVLGFRDRVTIRTNLRAHLNGQLLNSPAIVAKLPEVSRAA